MTDGQRCAKSLAEVDQVIERDPLAAVDRGGPVGVLARRSRIARPDGQGHALGEQLGIEQALAQPDLVVARLERRVALDRALQRARRERLDRVLDMTSRGRRTGGRDRGAVVPDWGGSRPESSERRRGSSSCARTRGYDGAMDGQRPTPRPQANAGSTGRRRTAIAATDQPAVPAGGGEPGAAGQGSPARVARGGDRGGSRRRPRDHRRGWAPDDDRRAPRHRRACWAGWSARWSGSAGARRRIASGAGCSRPAWPSAASHSARSDCGSSPARRAAHSTPSRTSRKSFGALVPLEVALAAGFAWWRA